MFTQKIKLAFTIFTFILFCGTTNAQLTIGGIGSDPVPGEPVAKFKCGQGIKSVTVDFPITTITAADCDAAQTELETRILANAGSWSLDCPDACMGLGGCDPAIENLSGFNSNYNTATGKCEFDGGTGNNIKIKYKCSPCGDGFVVVSIEISNPRGGDLLAGGRMAGESEDKLTLYPVPCQDALTLDLNSTFDLKNIQIQIFDITGKLVFAEQFGDRQDGQLLAGLDLSDLESGNFFVKMTAENGWSASAKITKLN
ncbi:MAG: hypothetical protein ACI959_001549 [Limisphaerales bacterium]|jgi:hypothetical protein